MERCRQYRDRIISIDDLKHLDIPKDTPSRAAFAVATTSPMVYGKIRRRVLEGHPFDFHFTAAAMIWISESVEFAEAAANPRMFASSGAFDLLSANKRFKITSRTFHNTYEFVDNSLGKYDELTTESDKIAAMIGDAIQYEPKEQIYLGLSMIPLLILKRWFQDEEVVPSMLNKIVKQLMHPPSLLGLSALCNIGRPIDPAEWEKAEKAEEPEEA